MQTQSLQSTPCATPEMASAMINGMAGEVGKGKNSKIVSMDVHEVDGLWIAVAVLGLEDPEPEDDEEDGNAASGDQSKKEGTPEANDIDVELLVANGNAPYFMKSPEPSEAQSAIPDADEGAPMVADVAKPNIDQTYEERDRVIAANENYSEEPDITGPETLTDNAEDLSEKLKADFEEADVEPTGPIRDINSASDPVIAAQVSEAEERLREKREQRMREGLPPDLPTPDDGANLTPST